ncbi:MAG: 2-phospho-L-lactate guanylyltransferase [Betaproteobacteria bacterium]|nr:2-phospho-L-lactate guanylyltransferase [Betaproteobacteria bacterium]
MLWTIVPIRGLASSKSRLAGTINDEERLALNDWMLRTVLEAIEGNQAGLDRCLVVSPSADALTLAQACGAQTLTEPAGVGLNQGLGFAMWHATTLGASQVMVLSADLPYVTSKAIDGLLDVARAGEWVVVAADHTGTGTNALVLRLPTTFTFQFGEGSLLLHREEAIRAGAAVVVHRDAALAHDLDSPADLARWQATLHK